MMSPWSLLIVMAALAPQLEPRMATLVEIVRPVLPYPGATRDGDLPEDNSAASRWFVIWPSSADETQVIVRANPLHPEVQAASAKAMAEINAAVAAAERRAQASYDRALEQLRRTGRSTELENVTLDDEGVAGERIDAELEVTIELSDAAPFDIATGVAPKVGEGGNGPTWIVEVAPNTYRPSSGDDRREHFRAAEAHLYFGLSEPPQVTRYADEARYRVTVPGRSEAFVVTLRGNTELVTMLLTTVDWAAMSRR
jgi:hypothetical protein